VACEVAFTTPRIVLSSAELLDGLESALAPAVASTAGIKIHRPTRMTPTFTNLKRLT
jgi:hypothetical protein